MAKLTRILTICVAVIICCPSTVFAGDPQWEKIAASIRPQMPETWQYVPIHSQTSPDIDEWWKQYSDSTLTMLIEKAVANNYNVAAAMKRMALARQQIQSVRSNIFPTVNLSAGYNLSQPAGAISHPIESSHSDGYFSLGADLNWEIDVFGRISQQMKVANAGVNVSKADYDAVLVALCADIASAYFQLRTYQQELKVITDHIKSQEKVVNMTEVRLETGIADGLQVSQAKTVLYTTLSTIPTLESSIRTTAISIAVLTGEYPDELMQELLKSQALPPAPPVLSAGVPADLLRRRPDLMECEMQLAQYAAQIGVAKKDFLPTLSVTGSIATASHNAGGLFGTHSLQYSVAPTLSWTLFDGFARKSTVAEA